MKLTLKRIALRPTYTIGKLYIDDVYFCDTIEDTVRDLNLGIAGAIGVLKCQPARGKYVG